MSLTTWANPLINPLLALELDDRSSLATTSPYPIVSTQACTRPILKSSSLVLVSVPPPQPATKMASESAMQLDWRRPLSSTKILVSIRKLLALIDEKGKVPMWLYSSMLNSSKGAKLVFLDDEDCETDGDSGLRMWAHTFKKSTMKRDPTYLAKLLSVSRTSIEDVTKGVLVPMRLYGYRWVGTNISKDTSRKILMDLALKLNSKSTSAPTSISLGCFETGSELCWLAC